MLSLNDRQLRILTDAAARLDVDRRAIFLERVSAMLKFRMIDDAAVREVVALAECGLRHDAA
jgi:hypothetical protein